MAPLSNGLGSKSAGPTGGRVEAAALGPKDRELVPVGGETILSPVAHSTTRPTAHSCLMISAHSWPLSFLFVLQLALEPLHASPLAPMALQPGLCPLDLLAIRLAVLFASLVIYCTTRFHLVVP